MIGGFALNPRDALTRRTIGGKPVVCFDSHHYALLPWQEWRQKLGQPLHLLTIDYHTDTHLAFLRYAHNVRGGNPAATKPHAKQDRAARLAKLSWDDDASVEAAVRDLHHDEHIDAAIQCGIVETVFVLGHERNDALESLEMEAWWERNPNILAQPGDPRPEPPFTYAIPSNRVVLLADDKPHQGEKALHKWRSEIIDTDYLRARLANAADVCRSAKEADPFSAPFILDIDLDAFNTRQAIEPKDPSAFYDLIRRAHGITIALEPDCVKNCQRKGQKLTAAWLEERLLAHIEKALSPPLPQAEDVNSSDLVDPKADDASTIEAT